MKKIIRTFNYSKSVFKLMHSLKEFPYYFKLFVTEFKDTWKNFDKKMSALDDARH